MATIYDDPKSVKHPVDSMAIRESGKAITSNLTAFGFAILADRIQRENKTAIDQKQTEILGRQNQIRALQDLLNDINKIIAVEKEIDFSDNLELQNKITQARKFGVNIPEKMDYAAPELAILKNNINNRIEDVSKLDGIVEAFRSHEGALDLSVNNNNSNSSNLQDKIHEAKQLGIQVPEKTKFTAEEAQNLKKKIDDLLIADPANPLLKNLSEIFKAVKNDVDFSKDFRAQNVLKKASEAGIPGLEKTTYTAEEIDDFKKKVNKEREILTTNLPKLKELSAELNKHKEIKKLTPELEKKINEARELGVKVPEKTKYTSKELEILKENIISRKKDLDTENKTALSELQEIKQNLDRLMTTLKEIMKTEHEAIMAAIRGIKGS